MSEEKRDVQVNMYVDVDNVAEDEVDTLWWSFQGFINSLKTEHKPKNFSFNANSYNRRYSALPITTAEEEVEEE